MSQHKKTKTITVTLSIELANQCKAFYDTDNVSEATRNALADFLLLPANEQKVSDFAMHRIIPDVANRKVTQQITVRLSKELFSIILSLSEKNTLSETVAKMLSRVLYFYTKSDSCYKESSAKLLSIIGNKFNPKMQDAIKNIKNTAALSNVAISVETCAGALGIFSNFQFAKEEILNDNNWNMVNLYRAIQENPRELIILARALKVDKSTFVQQMQLSKAITPSRKVNYEVAAGYLFLHATQYKCFKGYFDNTMTEKRYFDKLQNILPLHKRLNSGGNSNKEKTVITNYDIFDVIKKYRHKKNVLFIIDPPYLDADYYNRGKNKFGEEEHEKLAKTLCRIKHTDRNEFIYFCRITAIKKQCKEKRDEYDCHMKGRIDDWYYDKGFYFIDIPLEDKDGTIERIITSFDFAGAKFYGKGVS